MRLYHYSQILADQPSLTIVVHTHSSRLNGGLHGNVGCRLDGDLITDQYLMCGMSFFSVDLGGCGVGKTCLLCIGPKTGNLLPVQGEYNLYRTRVDDRVMYV